MSASLKTLVAAITAATAAFAFAQGTPPQPGAADPAVGAGQRSTQETPMGTTGTPGGGAAAGSTSSGATMSGSTSGGTSSGTMSSDTAASSSSSGSGSTGTTMRTARADRN